MSSQRDMTGISRAQMAQKKCAEGRSFGRKSVFFFTRRRGGELALRKKEATLASEGAGSVGEGPKQATPLGNTLLRIQLQVRRRGVGDGVHPEIGAH